MNIIDLLAILPFLLSLLVEGLEEWEMVGETGRMIRIVGVMRILRVFKLVRHFAGLQAIFLTLQQVNISLRNCIHTILSSSSFLSVAQKIYIPLCMFFFNVHIREDLNTDIILVSS